MLGWDAEGIGAAVYWEELDGPRQVEVHVGAVANRHRHQGGGVADEMLVTLFDILTERALDHGVDLVLVGTWIHERNRASQTMCRRNGLHQQALANEAGLQRWGADLLVAGAELPDA